METPVAGTPAPAVSTSKIVENAVEGKAGAEPAKTPEAAPEAKLDAKDDVFSTKFNQLARKERDFKAQMKAKQDAFEAERAAWIKERDAPKSEPAKKKNPIEILMDHGYSYEDATLYAMEHGAKPDPMDKVKEVETKLERMIREQQEEKDRAKAELEAKSASEKEELEKAAEAAKSGLITELKEFVAQNADKYELTSLYTQAEEIYDVMDGYYQKHGKILSKEEAADMVEKELEAQLEKAAKSKKLSSKFAAQSEPQKEPFSSKTLNNVATKTETTTKPAYKTDEERMRNAMAILERGV